MAKAKETLETANVNGFTKADIVASKQYEQYAVLLSCILEEEKLYTHEEVEGLIEQTLKQPVVEALN